MQTEGRNIFHLYNSERPWHLTIDPNYGMQVITNITIKIQTLNINALRSFCSTIQK